MLSLVEYEKSFITSGPDWSDLRRLILVFVGHIRHFVGFCHAAAKISTCKYKETIN